MGKSLRAWASAALAIVACLFWSGAARAQTPTAADFQKVTLDDNTQNPMELDVANDGRVFYIERDGRLQIWKPNTQQTVDGGHGPGDAQPGERPARPAARAGLRHQPVGLPLLLAAAGQHADAGRLALQGQRRHARPDLGAEDPHVPAPDRGVLPLVRARCTSARTAASTSPPATTPTRSTPTASTRSTSAPAAPSGTRSAPRATRTTSTARSCAIKPLDDPTGTPGVGTTYTIPAGNLFDESAGHRQQDPAGDLRHGLPQPVPLHRRP